MSAEPSADPRVERDRTDLLTFAGMVLAPAGIGAGLLYYFGLLRSRAYLDYFGVDDAALTFSATEHLSKSTEVIVTPLALIAIVAGAGLAAHVGLRAILRRAEEAGSVTATRNLITGATAVTMTLLLFSALVRGSERHFLNFTSLLALAIAILVIEYAVALVAEMRIQSGKKPAMTGRSVRVRRIIVGTGIGLAVFSAFTEYGLSRGRDIAEYTAQHTNTLHGVVVYTEKQLAITGPGVRAKNLGLKDSDFQYRYTGLLFLGRAQNRWILLPEKWTPGEAVIVVPESSGSRLDFVSRS